MSRSHVRCPTCRDGSFGDLEHIAACAARRLAELEGELRAARRDGAARMLEMVNLQIERRGMVTTGTLASAVLWGRWGRER